MRKNTYKTGFSIPANGGNLRDIREIAEDQLIKYSLNFNNMEEDIDIIDRWINFKIRLIPTKKRKINKLNIMIIWL